MAINFSVTVDGNAADDFQADIKQIFDDIGISEDLRIE
jgi:hypothetical protein